MIDWTKPIELGDGVPVSVECADNWLLGLPWIIRDDGEKISGFDALWAGDADHYGVVIRNRAQCLDAETPTLRDQFAMAALATMRENEQPHRAIAQRAYAITDAMLAERNKGK